MKLVYEFTPPADRRVAAIEEWWRANGDDPLLFRRELEETLDRLCEGRVVGVVYQTKRRRLQVLRVLLPKSGHWVYYTIDQTKQLLRIITVWGTSRRRQPKL